MRYIARMCPNDPSKRFLAIAGTRAEYLKLLPVLRGLGPDATLLWSHQQDLPYSAVDGDISMLRLPEVPHPLKRKSLLSELTYNIGEHLTLQRPRLIIVQGDTATALAGTLAANRLGLPVVHLEAGLRSNNFRSPFPEEAYRCAITRMASLHLAPSALARQRLLNEGLQPDHVEVVGSTAVDLVRSAFATLQAPKSCDSPSDQAAKPPQLLIDIHRRENTLRPLSTLIAAVHWLIDHHQWGIRVVRHINPLRARWVEDSFAGLRVQWLTEMSNQVWWQQACQASLVLTDSGAALEELPYLGARLCVYRRSTERPQAFATGHAIHILPTSAEAVGALLVAAYARTWPAPWSFSSDSPYGDGQAGMRAAAAVRRFGGRE